LSKAIIGHLAEDGVFLLAQAEQLPANIHVLAQCLRH
jgi:hypothetical protein